MTNKWFFPRDRFVRIRWPCWIKRRRKGRLRLTVSCLLFALTLTISVIFVHVCMIWSMCVYVEHVCVFICTYMCRGHRTTLGVVPQVPSGTSRQNLLLVRKLSSRLGYWASRLQGSSLSILLVKELQAHTVFPGFLKWVLWHSCSGSQACRANIVPTDPSSPLALLGILLPGGPASPC